MFTGVDKKIRVALVLAALAGLRNPEAAVPELFSVTLHDEIIGKKASHCGQSWPLNCACSVDE